MHLREEHLVNHHHQRHHRHHRHHQKHHHHHHPVSSKHLLSISYVPRTINTNIHTVCIYSSLKPHEIGQSS